MSCRGVPERADNDTSDGIWLSERQQYFSEHPSWQASGRMAIRDKNRGIGLNFDWKTLNNEEYELVLRTTGGRWVLKVRPGFAELEGTKIGHLVDSEPGPLVEQALGWPLPVTLMQDWFRSLPGDQKARLRFAGDGSLLNIRYDDWSIDYTRYEVISAGIETDVLMPTRLEAERTPYLVRVLVSDWVLGE